MSTSWRDRFDKSFISPEKKLSLDEILKEAQDTYLGWMAASLTAFHSDFNEDQVDELDRIFQGESRICSIANDCYNYAINGRFRLAKNAQEQEQMNDDWVCLAFLVLSARPGIEEFILNVRGRSIGVPVKLEQLFSMHKYGLCLISLPSMDLTKIRFRYRYFLVSQSLAISRSKRSPC